MDGRLRHPAGFLSGGGDTPSPTPIAVEGAAQVFKDENCTEYASGDMSGKPTVYIRFNDNIPAGTRWLESKDGPGDDRLDFSDGIDFMGSWVDDTFTLPVEAGTVLELPGKYDFDSREISEDECIYNFIQ